MLEANGLPTVGIYISAFAHVPDEMGIARALITPNPLGRPLGAPHDSERQRDVVGAALEMFEVAEPTIREFQLPYRPTPGLR